MSDTGVTTFFTRNANFTLHRKVTFRPVSSIVQLSLSHCVCPIPTNGMPEETVPKSSKYFHLKVKNMFDTRELLQKPDLPEVNLCGPILNYNTLFTDGHNLCA